METDGKRTATDVLLSIESRLDTLERRVQNSENLLKITLGRLNEALAGAQAPQVSQSVISPSSQSTSHPRPVVNRENFDGRPKTSEFAKQAAQFGMDVEDDEPQKIEQTFVAKPNDETELVDHDELIEGPGRSAATRGQRGPKSKGAKASVSQVLNAGEAPLFLANVEIFDETGQLVNQGRTNTKGRWLMALEPGEYQVHVSKRFPPDSGRVPVDTTYQISVPQANKPLELDLLDVG